MKKVILLFVTLMFTVQISAQISWNVKAGAGITNFSDPGFVIKGGVGMDIPFSFNWSFTPSIEFAYKELNEIGTGNNDTWCNPYLQIPVDVAYRFWIGGQANMVLKAGPYVGLRFGGDLNDGVDAGLNAGVNFELSRFILGVDYEYGLVDTYTDGMYGNGYCKTRAFYFVVGYKW